MLRSIFGGVEILSAILIFLSYFPCLAHTGLFLALIVLQLLAQKLLMLFAFFNDFIDLLLLVLAVSLQTVANFLLFSSSPMKKISLHSLYPALLLLLSHQLFPKPFFLFCIG